MFPTDKVSTFVTGTPSTGQQRPFLLAIVLVMSAGAWWQNAGDSSRYPVQKFSRTPTPTVVAELDFTNAEASWSGLRFDSRGNLEVDALTHTALADAIAMLNVDTLKPRTERLSFLLAKQFGPDARQQIMELVHLLHEYEQKERSWLQDNGGRNPPDYEELFQLQDDFLGRGLARKLFHEQRRLARLMLASHEIQNNPDLTQAQRNEALMDLQSAFEDGGPNE
ncbi:hypothetical protein ACXYTJ_10380 [Gilvimarinus sp. F26214L]|uniref:hypothetical protein n=1 Tax=Gilvimarinus sp. DZF01 TaxID=3461371 RepID=UPI004045AED8